MKRNTGYQRLLMAAAVLLLSACGTKEIKWNGGIYTGGVTDGKPEGTGTYLRGDLSYHGGWHDGLADGFGKYVHGDTTYIGHFRQGIRQGDGQLAIGSDTTLYKGRFVSGQRWGKGVLTDGRGRVWEGEWRADTLTYGTLRDGKGVYRGAFNHKGLPDGFGTYNADNAVSSYEGQWSDGRRDSFGIDISASRGIRCGWWNKEHFLGERMRFTSQRVYGIDISHYQHGGRPRRRFKGYPIQWKNLRITSLGPNSRNNVGRVNYPVSFCYIKSTQGTKILNNYYPSDARRARAAGIKVGAYHFMEMRPAAPQARWFLRKTPIAAGDLPPMLDVEPLPSQIRKMGGEQILFREMLVWLKIVEQATGKKPILYISQTFVNRYLPNAPQKLQEYDVWIARYSQYKPYVHLLYWQHTPYGRVKGIRGDVDINVFNGSKAQFRRYAAGQQQ